MVLIDTNVLIHAANKNSEFHLACRRLLEEFRVGTSPWYLSWPICYEFLRVCTHPNVLQHPWSLPGAWGFLESILATPTAGLLEPTSRHAVVLGEIVAKIPHLRGNILHDVHTASLMREHGIKQIYTSDTDFSRFPFLTVLDPLAA
jgi:hypothetical protein